MIRHIVMWSLKDSHLNKNKAELAVEMKSRLLELNDKISEIKKIEVGINGANFDRNYDITLIAEYDNFEDLAVYTNHPEHQRVVKFIREFSTAKAAVDYEF